MLAITTPPPEIDSVNEGAFVLKVSGSARTVTVANLLVVSQVELPESFLAGWADYEAGRVVTWNVL